MRTVVCCVDVARRSLLRLAGIYVNCSEKLTDTGEWFEILRMSQFENLLT